MADLTIAFVAVAAGNVAFHVLAGRMLGPAEYGSLGAMSTLLLALSVPAGAVQVALTAETARLHDQGHRVRWLPTLLRFLGAGALCAAAIAAVAPWLIHYLGLRDLWAPTMLALFFVPAFGGIVARAVLLGRRQYLRLGTVLVAATAIRLALGVVVLQYIPTMSAALAVMLVSEVLGFVALLRAAEPTPTTNSAPVPWDLRIEWSELVGAVAAFGGFWLLVGVDVMVARRHFSAETAGLYAATALAARSVLFVPQSIASAALPDLALPGVDGRRALLRTTVLCAAFGGVSALVLAAAGPTVLPVVLGAEYNFSTVTLAVLGGAGVAAGVLNVMVSWCLAQGAAVRANASWLGVPVVIVVGAFVAGPAGLAVATLTTLATVTLLTSVGLHGRLAVDAVHLVDAHRSTPTCDVTVVLPVCNEGAAGVETVTATVAAMGLFDAEIIVVDDGSTDGAWDDPPPGLADSITLIRLPVNQGKGEALRIGMRAARGEVIALLDGDGDLAPLHLPPMLEALDRYGADGVVGSKVHPQASADRSVMRTLLSALAVRAVRLLFDVEVADTQVGVKLYRREVVERVLGDTRERGFLFDVEFLALASARGHRHIVEYPVRLARPTNTSVTPTATLRTIAGLGALAWRWHSATNQERSARENPPLQLA